jgi:hypothetical protein
LSTTCQFGTTRSLRREREQDRRSVADDNGEVIGVKLALEAEGIAVERNGAVHVRDQQCRRDSGEYRDAVTVRCERSGVRTRQRERQPSSIVRST